MEFADFRIAYRPKPSLVELILVWTIDPTCVWTVFDAVVDDYPVSKRATVGFEKHLLFWVESQHCCCSVPFAPVPLYMYASMFPTTATEISHSAVDPWLG